MFVRYYSVLAAASAFVAVVANGLTKEENLETLSLPYPKEGCTIPLSIGDGTPSAAENSNGTKFMIVMQLGRVGSTWLTEMIGKHERVTCKQEQLANAGTVAKEMRMPRLKEYYSGEAWRHRGAKQKSGVIFDKDLETARMLASLDVRFICLARSNPVEFSLAQINGDAHQRSCKDHSFRGGQSTCYTEEDSRAEINMAIWDRPGFFGQVHLMARKNAKFYEDCREIAKETPVLWLEYGDLHCDTENAMRKIESFLDIEPSPNGTYTSSQQKLTGSPREIIDNFDKLEELLTNVSTVFGAGLDLANVCEHRGNDTLISPNMTTPGFCPLKRSSSS